MHLPRPRLATLLACTAIASGTEPEDAPIAEYLDAQFRRSAETQPESFATAADWGAYRDATLRLLSEKTFAAWPSEVGGTSCEQQFSVAKGGVQFSRHAFSSEASVSLPLYVVHREGLPAAELDLVVLNVLDEDGWRDFLANMGAAFPGAFPGRKMPELARENHESEWRMYQNMKWGMAYLPPRGIGPSAWDEEQADQVERSLALLGATVDSVRVWDIRRGITALRGIEGMDEPKLWLQSWGGMAANTVYASLFEDGIHRMDLHDLPASHRSSEAPVLPGVLRITDLPLVTAMAAERAQIALYTPESERWQRLEEIGDLLGWNKQVRLRDPVPKK